MTQSDRTDREQTQRQTEPEPERNVVQEAANPPLSATGHLLKFYGAKQTSSGWTLNNVLCGEDVEMCNTYAFYSPLFSLSSRLL